MEGYLQIKYYNYLLDSDSIEVIIKHIVSDKDHETFINILELLKLNNTISFETLFDILLSSNVKYLNNIYDNFNINCYDFYNYILDMDINNKYLVIERLVNTCKYINLHNILLTSKNKKNITYTDIEIEFSFNKFTNTNRIFCYKENNIYNKINSDNNYVDNPFNYIPT